MLSQLERTAPDELYYTSSAKIWQVDPEKLQDGKDRIHKELKDLFDQWTGWFESNDFDEGIRMERVRQLTLCIEETEYQSDPKDDLLTQIWKRQLQTCQTQVGWNQVTQKTVDMMRSSACNPFDEAYPKITYDKGEKTYEGGVLPKGLLTPAPYSADDARHKENLVIERNASSIWRQMRFMQMWVNMDCDEAATAQKAEYRQETTQRFCDGETAIWNEFIQHYSGYIGDEPKDITAQVDPHGTFESRQMRVYVAAHRLASGAELISVAVLPKDPGASTPVTLEVPTRWGSPQITAPDDVFRYLEGTAKAEQAVVICARRLLLAPTVEEFRPDDPVYRKPVNPDNEAFEIYDTLCTADMAGMIEEVLPFYGQHCGSTLQAKLLWGSATGAGRLMADLAVHPEIDAPVVLMAPVNGIEPTNAHWSYLGPWMGIGEHGYTKEDVRVATDIMESAKKLTDCKGRKVLILGAPKNPVYPKAACLQGASMDELCRTLSEKGCAVTLVNPDYELQEWPVPGIRIYPKLAEGSAAEWFADLK